MKKFVDLNFVVHPQGQSINDTIQRYSESVHYLSFLKNWFEVEMVMHGDEEQVIIDGVQYTSISSTDGFWNTFSSTIQYLKSIQPDYILVQGLVFPIQVIALKRARPKAAKIMVQHHGGVPFQNPLKQFLQKWADRCIDAYLFTSIGNATPWLEKRVIGSVDKCKQVLEASTHMQMLDKKESIAKTGMQGLPNFLWVGRLDANKDPLTVLNAFAQYLENNGKGQLYMIFQTNDMLPQVQQLTDNNVMLKEKVKLVGEVRHSDLAYWFSAADYYVSGSHYEGSGYALIESMACGCTPIVTAIPSFKAIIENCTNAYLYNPGEAEGLYNILQSLPDIKETEDRGTIVRHFATQLSFKAIADSIYKVCNSL
jgi:glycosyltransferase involved in cell wall biosynthesis